VLPYWDGEGGKGDPVFRNKIIIGNDVWIGDNVFLLGGCKIGDGAVIGSYSVVAGEIPPYSIAVGNPCKVIRSRFRQDQINKLLELKWWDWTEDKVRENISLLCSDNIDRFLENNYEIL
jgi:virginiamycin A acetyltransferase